ncbi:hypothetical protein NDU88_004228 [Pleurodeles waltl]|uniref:Uncharacterized protein n=1 Tax=Pleurodeles waltl TaxID=8319 RepID=A0AAV7V0L3_PLEWA|nr:hypothetical protein NDU88_004228 [Pleurodeles waltl]
MLVTRGSGGIRALCRVSIVYGATAQGPGRITARAPQSPASRVSAAPFFQGHRLGIASVPGHTPARSPRRQLSPAQVCQGAASPSRAARRRFFCGAAGARLEAGCYFGVQRPGSQTN